jgi:hypothetical protein
MKSLLPLRFAQGPRGRTRFMGPRHSCLGAIRSKESSSVPAASSGKKRQIEKVVEMFLAARHLHRRFLLVRSYRHILGRLILVSNLAGGSTRSAECRVATDNTAETGPAGNRNPASGSHPGDRGGRVSGATPDHCRLASGHEGSASFRPGSQPGQDLRETLCGSAPDDGNWNA